MGPASARRSLAAGLGGIIGGWPQIGSMGSELLGVSRDHPGRGRQNQLIAIEATAVEIVVRVSRNLPAVAANDDRIRFNREEDCERVESEFVDSRAASVASSMTRVSDSGFTRTSTNGLDGRPPQAAWLLANINRPAIESFLKGFVKSNRQAEFVGVGRGHPAVSCVPVPHHACPLFAVGCQRHAV